MNNDDVTTDARETRPPNSRRWSDDDVATLRRLAWSLTAVQIAAILGRTALAVRTKAAHARIRLRSDGG